MISPVQITAYHTVIAAAATFPPYLWAAGIVVALVAAYCNYALSLRSA